MTSARASAPLRKLSTHQIGLAFETHALDFLNRDLRMSLERVGGAGDGGVDLRGWWWLPRIPAKRNRRGSQDMSPGTDSGSNDSAFLSTSTSTALSERKRISPPGLKRDGTPDPRRIQGLRVLAQCKAEKAKLGPRAVRELEGVMAHLHLAMPQAAPSRATSKINTPAMAVLLSQSGFTTASMQHAQRSAAPLLLVHLPGGRPVLDTDSGALGSEPELGLCADDVQAGSNSTPTSAKSSAKTQSKTASDAPAPLIPVEGAWWNPALSAMLVRAGVELRRELVLGAEVQSRIGVWHAGMRMGRYGPTLPSDDM